MSKTLLRVTDLIYEDDNDLVVKLVGRTEDGRRVAKNIFGTEPYLFIPESAPSPESFEENEATIVDVRGGFKSYDNVPLLQVVTRYPSGVRKIRKEYAKEERYESDLIYERRCTADYDLSGYLRVPEESSFDISKVQSVATEDVEEPIEPRVCYIDIEAEAPDQFYDEFAEDAPNAVQAVTMYDSYDEEYTLLCLDPDHEVDPGKIRGYIEDHWAGSDHAEGYADAPITFRRFGDETSLLKDFIHYIQEKRPDVATGWNYVDFDHEYLVSRIRDNDNLNEHALSDVGSVGGWKTERYVPGLPGVDMMSAMQKILYGQRESWSLEYIASSELGIGKVNEQGNAYDEDRSMFMAYNVVDTQLCVALDDVRGVMQFWYQVAEICSIPIYSVGSTMKECEGYLFKHRTPNEILPETPEDRELDDISGGFVMPPSDGVKDWVAVTDLKSLYPSSIITCNISKETITRDPDEADLIVPDMPLNYDAVDGDITEDDIGWDLEEDDAIGFKLDKEGILPKYLKLLFSEREALKTLRNTFEPGTREYNRYDSQQRAVKVIMNSFFGVSDNDYFRLSADGLGDAITSASRFVQWYGVQQIESQGYDVIYGDTDSLMLELVEEGEEVTTEDVIDRGKQLDADLVDLMSPISEEFGIPDEHPFVDVDELPHDRLSSEENHLWQYEFEKLYRRFFQPGSKKRYAGWIVWKEGKRVDSTDTVGMESQRSDSPALAKEIQTKFIELVLKSGSFEELTEFVQEKVKGIREMSYNVDDIGVPSTINKPVDAYPNGPMPRGVRHVNEYVDEYEWSVGDDPWLMYVNGVPQGVGSTDVLALPWTADALPDGYELDVDQHVYKAVKQPITAIVEETDYTWSELKTGRTEQSVLGGSSGGGEPDFGETTVTEPDFGDDDKKDSKPKQNSAFDW